MIEDVQVASCVERQARDLRERIPALGRDRADAIDLLEIGSERPVHAGEIDHLLGPGGNTHGGRKEDSVQQTGTCAERYGASWAAVDTA
ncbi:hypothetical protein [Candidatus Palauibacter sp.]|uniref:hypothetical protein n=1 Tax=Candidatus Palauibacter sp. TaxID=3101350 RepID=UPI003AF25053